MIRRFKLDRKKIITADDVHMFIPSSPGPEIGVGSIGTYKKLGYYFLVESENGQGKRYIDVSAVDIHLDEYSNDAVFSHVDLESRIPFTDFLQWSNLQNLYDVSEVFGKKKVIQSVV